MSLSFSLPRDISTASAYGLQVALLLPMSTLSLFWTMFTTKTALMPLQIGWCIPSENSTRSILLCFFSAAQKPAGTKMFLLEH